MAEKIKKTEVAGSAAGLQFLGVILIVVGLSLGGFGVIVLGLSGVLLLIYGGFKANVLKCSDCRGKVEKAARVCPHCRAQFDL